MSTHCVNSSHSSDEDISAESMVEVQFDDEDVKPDISSLMWHCNNLNQDPDDLDEEIESNSDNVQSSNRKDRSNIVMKIGETVVNERNFNGECQSSVKISQNVKPLSVKILRSKKSYICPVCSEEFDKKSLLTQHKSSEHPKKSKVKLKNVKITKDSIPSNICENSPNLVKSFKCDICEKCFKRKSTLDKHLTVHSSEKPFTCNICNKKFRLQAYLSEHSRVHTGEKPFSCNICNKKFARSSDFSVHQRVHTGEKPYTCSTCGKSFSSSGHLTAHFTVHSGVKPYSCSYCEKSFSYKVSLSNHERGHTGDKPFCCEECGKKFPRQNDLTTHLKLHSGDKPYSCSVCDKKFSKKGTLFDHSRVHTGEKPFECMVCSKTFAHRATLTAHHKRHFK